MKKQKQKNSNKVCQGKPCPYERLLRDLWKIEVGYRKSRKPTLEEILNRFFPYTASLGKK